MAEYLASLEMVPSVLFMPYTMPAEDDKKMYFEQIYKYIRFFDCFRFVSKRSSGLTSESINKLTRPRFGKRAETEGCYASLE